MNKYKFSIILSVYNVGEYLEEAIESLINQQNIEFEKDVQIIIINDGSTDNSEDICKSYIERYPNNIIYIAKENGGLSSARNEGLKYVEGEYVTFFDPDDKLAQNTLSNVYSFFDKKKEFIDVVAIPIVFFEGKQGEHLLNYKFKSTRIINLLEDYRDIQLSVATAFIKREVITRYKFNETLCMAEDAEVMVPILLEKCKYGVVKEATYWYRYRNAGGSIIQTSNYKKEAYTDCLEKFSLKTLKYAEEKLGFIPKFVQYIIAYELRWRVKINYIEQVLIPEEIALFKETLQQVLAKIEDIVILEQKMLSLDHKIYLLKLKYQSNYKLKELNYFNDIKFYLNGLKLYQLTSSQAVVEILKIQDNRIILEGYIESPVDSEDYIVEIVINDIAYEATSVKREARQIKSLDEIIKNRAGFKFEKAIDVESFTIKIRYKIGENIIEPKLKFGRYVKLYNNIDKSYFVQEKFCLVSMYNSIIGMKQGFKTNIGREYRFLKEIIKTKKHKIAYMRGIAYILKHLNKRPIWLFMDRTYKADDNAEYLIRYANKQKDGIKKYYIIQEDCEDYNRLKRDLDVVKYGSLKHKILLLLADRMISSHAADFARNHFEGNGLWFRNLQDFKFVFLQHGIIHNDASVALGKYSRNIDLFVTSATGEYNEICSEKYFYDDKVVKLTGLPRYDTLQNNNTKTILIMPTWRTFLVLSRDYSSKEKIYNENFINTDYFRRYNALINDPMILNVLKESGYKILFYIHPELQHQIEDFNKNELVEFAGMGTRYQEVINKASLLITDYSSVAFDFAYLKKPIMYYQFDREEFFGNHYKKGYFDYYDDGFGEVVEEHEALRDALIQYVNDNCKMRQLYLERVNNFYKYNDTDNCKRVYEEINKLG